ncbi:MAG: crotonase/enoyl-CoA hydratase family protein [Alphaproteobacteria bacterium]|nr:crotonase/enoyl-CoA hydratase family protein [Alphaproteobacteria bacterium]
MVDEVGETRPSYGSEFEYEPPRVQGSAVGSLGGVVRPVSRLIAVDAAVQAPDTQLFTDDFGELDVVFDEAERVLWYYMAPRGRPSFTRGMLGDIRRFQSQASETIGGTVDSRETSIRYLVLSSRIPGIFNLGGDLQLIGRLVREQNRAGLADYARACIDVLYRNVIGLNCPLVTASVVQGHALGGGFEAALSSKLIIAEEHAKFGFPEVLFNLFPGMGAYSLLARRIGPIDAERMITSGRTYKAEQLYELGVVDVLAPSGEGERAFYEHIGRNGRRFNAHLGVYRARQRFADVSYDELNDIATAWVDAAMSLGPADLRKIDRFAASQDKRQTA